MSFTVDYNAYPEGEQRVMAALTDCKKWLGTRDYRKVVKALSADHGRTSRNMLRLRLAMNGIQGFPAEVLLDEFWTPQRDLFDK